jgi:syntaxin 18
MNLTTEFNDCLSRKGHSRIEPFVFDTAKINEFLREAYRINTHITELTNYLRSIRRAYLTLEHRPRTKHNAIHKPKSSLPKSDEPLTDLQRNEIDLQTRHLLTTISSAIRQLSETAKLSLDLDANLAQQRRSKQGFGALGRWAAGGGIHTKTPEELEEEARLETIKMHRDGVLWFLQKWHVIFFFSSGLPSNSSARLERAGEMQRSMTAIRVEREVERSRSSLYKARGPGTMGLVDGIGVSGGARESWRDTSSTTGVDMDREEYERQQRQAMETMLSPEQIQMFEKFVYPVIQNPVYLFAWLISTREQHDMLKQYSDNLNKIKYFIPFPS